MKAKQYEVIAGYRVFRHKVGERFWATLTPEQEARKLGRTLALVREEPVRRVRTPAPEIRRPPVEEPKPERAEEDDNSKEQ